MRRLALLCVLLLSGCTDEAWLAERVVHDDPTMAEPVVGVRGYGRPFFVYHVEPDAVTAITPDGRSALIRNPAPRYVYDAEPIYVPETAATRGIAWVPPTAPTYVYGGQAIRVPRNDE